MLATVAKSALRQSLALLVLAGAASFALAANPPGSWTVLEPKDPGNLPVTGYRLNAKGDLAGWVTSNGIATPAYTAGGVLKHVPELPGQDSGAGGLATGINDSGDVVGLAVWKSGTLTFHAYLYRGGHVTDLNTVLGADTSLAYAINNAGQIAGQMTKSGERNGFLLNPDQTVVKLPDVVPVDISQAGHVVGRTSDFNSAFFFVDYNNNHVADPGDYTTLKAPIGYQAVANAVNATDAICGTMTGTDGNRHAVVWPSPNSDPGELPGSPGYLISADAMNDAGDVVGILGGNSPGPTLWPKGVNPVQLAAFISGAADHPQLFDVRDINNAGQILGNAMVDSLGTNTAVILTPPASATGLTGTWSALTVTHKTTNHKTVYTLAGSLTLKNTASAPSKPATVFYYGSADTTLDTGDAALTKNSKAMQTKVGALATGASKTFPLSYVVPAGQNPATLAGRYVIAKIQKGNSDGSDSIAAGGPITLAP